MPTTEWNKSWANNLKHFLNGGIKGEHYGDQWGDPEIEDHLQEVVRRFIKKYISDTTTTLEIGSGGGRWTQYLLACQNVYCVDLNHEMFDYIKNRFPSASNLHFIPTSGTDFPGVPTSSIDFVFSFGVLVHLDFDIITDYIENLSVLMRKDGIISIQFSNKRKEEAKKNPDFSENNPEMMIGLLENNRFKIIEIDDNLLPHSTIITAQYCC